MVWLGKDSIKKTTLKCNVLHWPRLDKLHYTDLISDHSGTPGMLVVISSLRWSWILKFNYAFAERLGGSILCLGQEQWSENWASCFLCGYSSEEVSEDDFNECISAGASLLIRVDLYSSMIRLDWSKQIQKGKEHPVHRDLSTSAIRPLDVNRKSELWDGLWGNASLWLGGWRRK